MDRLAVFLRGGALCDFFEADVFQIFERDGEGWGVIREARFDPVTADSPAALRESTARLLPLLDGCAILAGGHLGGLPFTVFDRAGLHIFEVAALSGAVFDELFLDVSRSAEESRMLADMLAGARPAETDTPGVYFLDLIALQTEYPEVSSKNALTDFLDGAPFRALRLVCKHIPPWLENSGKYNIAASETPDGNVSAVITRK
ncbi:MAG: hypothetical protein LBT36_03170 [Oscillospiraceae bacterium]|jgi:hypothetical protein|nr:hypothetical protein [Oscillospiraceae bacterium]